MVASKITTQAKIDYEKVLRGVVQKIGFDSYVDDLSSIDCDGLSYKTCEVLVRINKQRPDFAGGVHVGKEEMDYARATRVSCVATPATTTMPCL
jgi:S-adenosylmethionine synthetase